MVATVLLFLCAATSPAAAPPQAPPDNLSQVEALFDNEPLLIDRLRAFDRQQTALAEWDTDMAEDLGRQGETELAKEALQRARLRLTMLGKAYEMAAARFPDNAKIQTYYGEFLYDHAGDQAKALQLWKLAAALDGTLSAPLNDMAIHYCHVGDYDLGLRYFDQAIELEPHNPDYLFNLCQMYLVHFPVVQKRNKWDRPRVYMEAMKLSKKAARFCEGDLDVLQDYAVNFFAAEEFGAKPDWPAAAKAWQAARTAASTPEELFYTWMNEGRVWLRGGNGKRARACLSEALAIRPDSPVAKNLLAKTDAGKTP